MRRREVMLLLGGSMIAARDPTRRSQKAMPVIGFLGRRVESPE